MLASSESKKLNLRISPKTLVQHVLLLAVISSSHKGCLFEQNGIRLLGDSRGGINITETCHSVMLYVHCLSGLIEIHYELSFWILFR